MTIQPKYLAALSYPGVKIGQGAYGVASGTPVLSPIIDRSVNTVFADMITLNGLRAPTPTPTSGTFKVYAVLADGMALSTFETLSDGAAIGATSTSLGVSVEIASIDFTEVTNGGSPARFNRVVNLASFFGGVVPRKYRLLFINTLGVNMKSATMSGPNKLYEIVGVAADSV